MVTRGVPSVPMLSLLIGKLAPVTVTVLPARPEVGDSVIAGVDIVTDAEADTLALSVTAIDGAPAAKVVLLIGMIKLVTKSPPLSISTWDPKLILSVSMVVPPIVMVVTVADPPEVKFSPVTVIDWLGRAVVGDRVIVGVVVVWRGLSAKTGYGLPAGLPAAASKTSIVVSKQ